MRHITFFFKSDKNNFILIILLNFLIAFIANELIISEQIFYTSFSQQLEIERIQKFIGLYKKWEYIGYFISPVLLSIKLFVISLCIYIGIFLSNYKIRFRDLLSVVIKAEFILLLYNITKTILYFFININTFADISYFQPLSILQLIGAENVNKAFIYPLSILNIFELLYWFALAIGIKQLTKKSFDKSLLLVLLTYGIGLLAWVIFIMFLTVSLN